MEFPWIPSLDVVLRTYGGKIHLMIELKKEALADPFSQGQILRPMFAGLEPGKDFHILSLDAEVLRRVEFAPRQALILVAELNLLKQSRIALRENYGGIAGHYWLVGDALLARHRRHGQKLGTGYIGSRNALFREINRRVDWVFSNRAADLQTILNTVGAVPANRFRPG